MRVTPSQPTVLTTLLRGMQLLELVAASPDGITAKRLALESDLKPGTCYHLLRTLASVGYVARRPSGRFVLGPRGGSLARRMQMASGPPPQIIALLSELHTRTQETSYVCGWSDGSIVLQQFLTNRPQDGAPDSRLDIGYSGNMHARASCRSILAFLPEGHLHAVVDRLEMIPLTQHTADSHDRLMCDLRQIRRRGYAFEREEFAEGVACISAPFFDTSDLPVGSFTVSVSIERFGAKASTLTAAVREAASRATSLLQAESTAETVRLASPPVLPSRDALSKAPQHLARSL